MELIFPPLTNHHAKNHIGKPVCLLLQNETYVQGYLAAIRNDTIILSNQKLGASKTSSTRKNKQRKIRSDVNSIQKSKDNTTFDLKQITAVFEVPYIGYPLFI